ncbi:DUF305 domain-containing protein [Streptomyces sp. ADI98-10]|uniref:DUF305 domain-containing protein n=1 Tax=Streptomyces sp. ADI98-10 TaxID=1522763 RepID=UPI000F550357|nr:DUF305 domain-containing protein [Streptomyces sp. ADI98-10]RPK94028.1 hypothetical protein EES46_03615 [Streptomyces sp. ADI98-10]
MNTNRYLPRRVAMTATAVATGLVLAACGGDEGTSTADTTRSATSAPATPEAGRHNQADVTFAQEMIPHHRQAVVMSDMVDSHGASGEVKALAEKIKKAQTPEIETMTGWLKAWGEEVPTGIGMEDMPGMGHDDSDRPGMMGDEDISRLGKASGNAFDDMYLTMMIEHHEGAIEMAETEKTQGAYDPARTLADDIITSQTAEIAQMRTMLSAT